MKSTIALSVLLIVLFVMVGCQDKVEYPQSLECRISGTNGARFDGYYGDTLGNGYMIDTIIPLSLYWTLQDDTCAVVFNLGLDDHNLSMIAELYIDNDFITAETTSLNQPHILLIYPIPE